MRNYKNTNTKKAEELRKGIAFVVMTIFLIGLLSFFISGTVISQAKDDISADEAYMVTLEKEYRKEIRNYLAEEGFENCGVNLTKVILENGTREYTVLLHHDRLEKTSMEKQEEMLENIREKASLLENCSLEVEFFS